MDLPRGYEWHSNLFFLSLKVVQKQIHFFLKSRISKWHKYSREVLYGTPMGETCSWLSLRDNLPIFS